MFESEGGLKEDTVHYIALSLPVPPKEKSIVRGKKWKKAERSLASMLMEKGTVEVRYYSSRELS